MSAGAEAVYGPFSPQIQNRVASCADYLGRITRTLATNPSRHYVAEKATLLRDAAGRLAGSCHDVEGWLAECGQTVPVTGDDGIVVLYECGLQAGHDGGHRHEVRTPLSEARQVADDLAEVAVAVADQLGWLAHRAPSGLPPACELKQDLDPQLREIRRQLERLSSAVATLVASRRSDEQEQAHVCFACEFEADSLDDLAEHHLSTGH